MKALLLIDVQKDFCPGGSLAVANGNDIVPLINELMVESFKRGDLVVATQDWHPKGHGSFASTHDVPVFSMGTLKDMPQVMWPDHCVQNTDGANFHPELLDAPIVFCKGMDPTIDSYSGFFDNGGNNPSGLDAYLKQNGVTEVTIVGIATDYCVKFTALDAKKLGYTTRVMLKACAGVAPDTTAQAVQQLLDAGVTVDAGVVLK